MSKVTELENALTELFRKGTEVGYSETEIDEFLEDIDYYSTQYAELQANATRIENCVCFQ